jgi:hypothetical protein
VISQIEALKDKCTLFSNGSNVNQSILNEGRLLINLYSTLIYITSNTLKAEINGIVPTLFTEKDPSLI